jgi:hypothetical protein
MIATARRGKQRRGFIAALMLVIIMILTILMGVLLKIMLMRQADLHAAEQRLQAEWLAESGLDRALAKLASAPNYTGETWEIPATELAGRDDGLVVIAVEAVPGKPSARLIRARADYPKAELRRSRDTRTLTVDLNMLSNKSTDPKGDVKK